MTLIERRIAASRFQDLRDELAACLALATPSPALTYSDGEQPERRESLAPGLRGDLDEQ